jgi:predicted enzyme related to lactoylglutathione lyase
MKKITGFGGVFIKAKDPKALAAWYQDALELDFNNNSYIDLPFTDQEGKITPGYNVLSFFKANSNYFDPSDKQVMLNLRVHDLFALLDELKNKHVAIVGDPIDEEYGKFGWIMDPEGNKIELWKPVDELT